MKKLSFVVVFWWDSETSHGWQGKEASSKLLPTIPIRSYGEVLFEDDEYLVITADIDAENSHNNRRMVIPQACIEEIWEITV